MCDIPTKWVTRVARLAWIPQGHSYIYDNQLGFWLFMIRIIYESSPKPSHCHIQILNVRTVKENTWHAFMPSKDNNVPRDPHLQASLPFPHRQVKTNNTSWSMLTAWKMKIFQTHNDKEHATSETYIILVLLQSFIKPYQYSHHLTQHVPPSHRKKPDFLNYHRIIVVGGCSTRCRRIPTMLQRIRYEKAAGDGGSQGCLFCFLLVFPSCMNT